MSTIEFCSVAKNALIEIASKPLYSTDQICFVLLIDCCRRSLEILFCFWNLFHNVLPIYMMSV